MNVNDMIDQLVTFIEGATSELRFRDKQGNDLPIQVFDGYTPPKDPKKKENSDFPYVVVRYLGDEQNQNISLAQVRVICGIISIDDQRGWRDLLNLMNIIKTALLKAGIFGKRYRVEFPVKREIPEEQPAGEWFGYLTLNISTPSILEEGGYLKDVFG